MEKSTTMFGKFLYIRYVFIVAAVFLLLSAVIFLIAGAVYSIHGFIEFIHVGFLPNDEARPGVYLLEALDAFMVSMVFLIFGLGVARLFIFDKVESSELPAWLNIRDVKELKILLWETILVTLVVLCVSNLIKFPSRSWDVLIFPVVILILSLSLFLVRGKNSH